MKYMCAVTFLLVFISTSVVVAADPLKVHEAGVGPKIHGLQLGMAMTWPDMVATQKNIISRPKSLVPNMPAIRMPAIFGLIIADNYKAASHRWTFEKFPSNLPGKWLVVSFEGIAGKASLSNNGGGIASKLPKSGTLNDLFVILKQNGLNYIASPNIMLRDEQVVQYSFEKEDFSTEAATANDFAQWLSTTYSLGAMEQKDKNFEAGNPSEGWRVVVTNSNVTVFSMPIPDNTPK